MIPPDRRIRQTGFTLDKIGKSLPFTYQDFLSTLILKRKKERKIEERAVVAEESQGEKKEVRVGEILDPRLGQESVS